VDAKCYWRHHTEIAVKLLTNATLFALPTTARLTQALADPSRSLGAIGERLEGVVNRLALRRRWDIAEALNPLVFERSAG
jgi:hypothetical protein